MAKNTSVIAIDAAREAGVGEEARRRGSDDRCGAPTARTRSAARRRRTNAADDQRVAPAPRRPFDDPVEQRDQADGRQDACRRDRAAGRRRPSSWGRATSTAMIATMTNGTLTRKIEPHQKCSSRKPPASGPMATPRPDTPAHSAIARARSLGVAEDVGEDRQRRRHDERRAEALDAAQEDQRVGRVDPRAAERAERRRSRGRR